MGMSAKSKMKRDANKVKEGKSKLVPSPIVATPPQATNVPQSDEPQELATLGTSSTNEPPSPSKRSREDAGL